MRHLTILRTKSFVGALASLKVYIEDPDTAELSINETPCRKLGVLKNGEAVTFEIGDGACKVFVIADAVSRNYCNDFYQIPEGTEDVSLSGRPRFNPANGNAFRFDDNDGEEARANRRQGTNRGRVILIASIVFGLLIGIVAGYFIVSGFSVRDKTFKKSEISITLTTQFHPVADPDFYLCLDSKRVAVFVSRASFASAEWAKDATPKDFAYMFASNQEGNYALQKSADGMDWVELDHTAADGTQLHSFVFAYKSDNAAWLVQFAVEKEYLSDFESKVMTWAKSVRFDPA